MKQAFEQRAAGLTSEWRSADDSGPTAIGTIGRAYDLTSSILRAAVDDDVIALSPCRSIDLPTIAVKLSQRSFVMPASRQSKRPRGSPAGVAGMPGRGRRPRRSFQSPAT